MAASTLSTTTATPHRLATARLERATGADAARAWAEARIRPRPVSPSTSSAAATAAAYLAAGTASPADHTFPEASAK